MSKRTKPKTNEIKWGSYVGAGLAIGLVVGMLLGFGIGTLSGRTGLWMSYGASIGLIAGQP
jgi:hypothetical protein